MKILLPQFQTALGTAIHATSVVEALAGAVPQSEIVVAGDSLAEQIYAANPHVKAVLPIPSPVQNFSGALRAIRAHKLFGGEPHTVLLTSGNERTKITLWSALAGNSRRIGFAVLPELVHQPLAWDPAGSQISNNLRLLRELGLHTTHTPPRMYVTPEQAACAEERLIALGSAPDRQRVAFVTQTSPTQRKQWPAERWIALANTLAGREQADLIFVGTAGEAAAIDALRTRIAHQTFSVAGKTGIGELAAIFTRCDFGITLDTGPLHVGRAVGLPMVIIAPAWSPVHEWLPVDDPRYRILKNSDWAPPAPDSYVIDEVSLDDVLAAAYILMITPAANRQIRSNADVMALKPDPKA